MQTGDTSTSVLSNCASDVCRSTESRNQWNQKLVRHKILRDSHGGFIPCISIGDDRNCRVQACNHLSSLSCKERPSMEVINICVYYPTHLDEIIHGSNSKIWLSETRCSGSCSTGCLKKRTIRRNFTQTTRTLRTSGTSSQSRLQGRIVR